MESLNTVNADSKIADDYHYILENAFDPTPKGVLLKELDSDFSTSYDSGRQVSPPPAPHPEGLGRAKGKPRVSRQDVISLIISVICMVLAILVITPTLPFAWMLQYTGQIIVVGALLAIQAVCLRSVSSPFFVMVEAKYGGSTLQNFDAILLGQGWASGATFYWRLIIMAMIILPLAVSVAYKRFTGGISSRVVDARDYHPSGGAYYGLTGPPGLSKLGYHTGTTIMVNATVPYFVNMNISKPFLEENQLPKPYGFNTLLLSNNRTALLDAPWSDYVLHLQRNLNSALQSFELSAEVNATVAYFDPTLEGHRDYNDTVWDPYRESLIGTYANLYSAHVFNDWQVDFLNALYGNQSWCMIALVPSYGEYPNPVVKPREINDFVNHAALFTTRRETCHGTWTITPSSIMLTGGDCPGHALPKSEQRILTDRLLAMDSWYPPLLVEYLGAFTPPSYPPSPWLLPTMTTTVGAMYWSRLVGLRNDSLAKPFAAQTKYPPPRHQRERLVSFRPAMRPAAGLYTLLALSPALAVVFMLLEATLLASVPLGRGFGMVALLAGVERESLGVLEGAGLSGELKRQVRVRVGVTQGGVEEGSDGIRSMHYWLDSESPNMVLTDRKELLH